MRIIVCLDDRNGMAFNHRRQSRDRAVNEDIVKMLNGEALRLTAYSEKLFSETDVAFVIHERPCEGAGEHEWCFLEETSPSSYLCNTERLVIYRWNRHYPSDVCFDFDPARDGFSLTERVEFGGSSHEKITKEIYEK